jgi:hypothetical protein
MRPVVEPRSAKTSGPALSDRLGPSQERILATSLDAERLRDVVVSAERQAAHLVLDGVASREEQDGHLHSIGGEPLGDREAVHVGKHHVEHDQRRAEVLDGLQARPSGARRLDLEPFVAERHRDEVRDPWLVVHDQDALRVHAMTLARFAEKSLRSGTRRRAIDRP